MRFVDLVAILLSAQVFLTPAIPSTAKVISLSNVQGTGIKGIRDLIEAEKYLWRDSWDTWYENSNSLQVAAALRKQSYGDPNPIAGSAIVVPGHGDAALSHVASILKNRKEPPSVREGEPCSLFFYSYALPNSQLVINRIDKLGNSIRVEYVVEGAASLQGSGASFAIIPIGTLKQGFLNVEICSAAENPFEQLVCKSTTVEIAKTLRLIPASSIYVYRMPEGKDVECIDFGTSATSPLQKLKMSLSGPSNNDKVLLVAGDIKQALTEAASALAGITESKEALTPEDELWVIFYARLGPTYVRLVSAVDDVSRVQITFQQTTHSSVNSTRHIALIPIGKRGVGKLRIEVVESPTVTEHGLAVEKHYKGSRGVSGSASYTIAQSR